MAVQPTPPLEVDHSVDDTRGTRTDSSVWLPRVFCVPDPESRVAAVIHKMPGKWWRLGRWDFATGAYEEGAWFNGRLYPQRCDLSPGGRWFSYLAAKYGSRWPAGETYNAVSRLPWLKALAAWQEYGTWSRGQHFGPDPAAWPAGAPAVGDVSILDSVGGIVKTNAAQFAVERRRGWVESASTPPRDPEDRWDQRRDMVMEKPSPDPECAAVLSVRSQFAALRSCPTSSPPDPAAYRLTQCGQTAVLTGVQWADWTFDGRLAVVTGSGLLQILDGRGQQVLRETRPRDGGPRPVPAPAWASEW